MNKEEEERQGRYTIQSIDKALDLLELLADRGSLSLIELNELLEQPKSSTYRIVLTLENRGFISRSDEDGKYCLGYKQLMLTRNLLERNTLRSAALQEMKRLSERYGDTVNLGVLVGGSVLYVEIIESTHALRMTDAIGSRSPFHATAIGKAIAAYLPQSAVHELVASYGLPAIMPNTIVSEDKLFAELEHIRTMGYALDDQEIVEGARCLAAPVFDLHGHPLGAISLSGAAHRFAADKVPEIAVHLREAAAVASRKLGYVQGP
ncbi:transcriptional regulator, IclR family [Paenibacillus sp. UNCCL117]|uniref:IclR family transcriptional regulator n=1 Tax=unclassified Paenibacillus TaxID=185978 RepID=UPI000881035F|nr:MULTISPECIES: IclR family transcriptional regulator [unclassified Paenibacillus]SDD62655.1 transcriptional regulator, IclR family [Paenibacillus sp. cl123]SFW67672.1 transcriptional regulator, IclR family [Paenibacillus sp. UNCCL117]